MSSLKNPRIYSGSINYVDPNDGHPVQRGMGVAFELIIDNETGTRCYALPGAINCVKGDR